MVAFSITHSNKAILVFSMQENLKPNEEAVETVCQCAEDKQEEEQEGLLLQEDSNPRCGDAE